MNTKILIFLAFHDKLFSKFITAYTTSKWKAETCNHLKERTIAEHWKADVNYRNELENMMQLRMCCHTGTIQAVQSARKVKQKQGAIFRIMRNRLRTEIFTFALMQYNRNCRDSVYSSPSISTLSCIFTLTWKFFGGDSCFLVCFFFWWGFFRTRHYIVKTRQRSIQN